MGWDLDRGRRGIVCFVCRGKGQMLAMHVATGRQELVACRDCGGEGFVKHCVACQGTGRLDAGELSPALIDCPECSGKGYPQPKRFYFQT